MTPYELALQLYESRPDMSFSDDLAAHMRRGYVICTPEAFGMARPVRRDWAAERLANPLEVESLATADTWFMWLLAGDLATASQWLPCEMEWLAFARRDGGVKFVKSERLLQKALAFAR